MRVELKSLSYWLISKGKALYRYAPYHAKEAGNHLETKNISTKWY